MVAQMPRLCVGIYSWAGLGKAQEEEAVNYRDDRVLPSCRIYTILGIFLVMILRMVFKKNVFKEIADMEGFKPAKY